MPLEGPQPRRSLYALTPAAGARECGAGLRGQPPRLTPGLPLRHPPPRREAPCSARCWRLRSSASARARAPRRRRPSPAPPTRAPGRCGAAINQANANVNRSVIDVQPPGGRRDHDQRRPPTCRSDHVAPVRGRTARGVVSSTPSTPRGRSRSTPTTACIRGPHDPRLVRRRRRPTGSRSPATGNHARGQPDRHDTPAADAWTSQNLTTGVVITGNANVVQGRRDRREQR